MKRIHLFLFVTSLILAGCTLTPRIAGQVGNQAEAVGETLNPVQQTAMASAVTPATLEASSNNNAFWIKINQPLDGEVVNSQQVEMKGQAALGTTISINDAIVYTGSSQDFQLTLNLVNGANLFEIVASDVNGNEVTLYLNVYFEP